METALQSQCLTPLNDVKTKMLFDLVINVNFGPEPESDPESDQKFPVKSDPDPELSVSV